MLYNHKRAIQQEDITLVKIYASNMGGPKYIKQLITNIKELIDSNTIIVRNFNTHLHQWTDHPNRKSTSEQWRTGPDGFNRYIQNILS